jgi:hypothetical protein
MNTEKISNALTETLKNNELKNLAGDISEVALDNLINHDLLREIPVIKSLINITKGFSQIKDQLFLKKIIAFLSQSKKIKAEERRIMIDKIDNSKKYRLKIGEKLLYLIDKSDDWEKAELLSVFFNAFIKNKITYEEFIKTSKIFEKLTIYDLQVFQKIVKKNKSEYFKINNFGEDENGLSELINSDLFIYYIDEVRVEDEDDWKMNRKYKTEGGELIVEVSSLGKKISEILVYLPK